MLKFLIQAFVIPGLGISAHVNTAKPATLKKLFDVFTGNKKVADGAFNAKFFAEFANAGFRKAQEVAKFPVVQAIPLARDMSALRDDGFNYRIECEVSNGYGIVYLTGPKTEFAFATGAT